MAHLNEANIVCDKSRSILRMNLEVTNWQVVFSRIDLANVVITNNDLVPVASKIKAIQDHSSHLPCDRKARQCDQIGHF